ncbi:hypothetical protein [Spirosoma panaciterrae]|uniref:hypothetical protein n=1 Tax=Spirosoma panaciterrae TaxID=496058 RepID=UPI000374B17A|nr:hypothetical protein [Spirosoma panaciterrae]
MTNPYPFELGGKYWTEFTMQLVINKAIRPNDQNPNEDFLSASMVLVLIPMRREDGKIIELLEPAYYQTFIVSDLFRSVDQNLLQGVGTAQQAIQLFINAQPKPSWL